MMRKLLRILTLLFFGMIWLAGCHTEIINALYRTEIIPDDYRYGDLYRLSNLSQFRAEPTPCSHPEFSPVSGTKKVALYLIGDSFTEPQRLDSSHFDVDYYQYAHWGTQLHLKLDTSLTNIILLESVERKIIEHFSDPIANVVPDTATFVTLPTGGSFVNRLDQVFASAPTEDRLATLLFQFDPMLKFKEWKSWINQRWFDRVEPKVTVSKDGSTLAYYEDTDSTLVGSSFKYISNARVDSLVNVMNYDEAYLKSLGFDVVWMSLIPNKASVLMPKYGQYNQLVQRIDQHPDLAVPHINVFPAFVQSPTNPYLLSDSHWSCAGQSLWLRTLNDKLAAVSR